MNIIKEFKKFISRGNVVELSTGIVLGAAFTKITSSLVADILMPPIGLLISGINFKNIAVVLKKAVVNTKGEIIHEAVSLNIGNFIQATIDFLIIAFVIFIVVKMMNQLKKKEAEKVVTPNTPSREEVLLAEIRDILKSK